MIETIIDILMALSIMLIIVMLLLIIIRLNESIYSEKLNYFNQQLAMADILLNRKYNEK